jgi:hypothetical protein
MGYVLVQCWSRICSCMETCCQDIDAINLA